MTNITDNQDIKTDKGVAKTDKSHIEKKESVTNKMLGSNLKSKVNNKKKTSIWIRDILLGIVNVVFVAGLIYLLKYIPARAQEMRSLRTASLVSSVEADTEVQKFDIEANQGSTEKLKNLFPDETGLLGFVDEVEKLKVSGSVIGFSFQSKNPVMDKTKNFGLPIIIEMSGTWAQISEDIQKIQSLPYLFRPVTFDAEEIPEESLVLLKYGGFLYVNKSLEKN